MTNAILAELVQYLKPHANPQQASSMKAYMRNQFDFLGIRKPELTSLAKAWIQRQGLTARDELIQLIDGLWAKPQREYQYIALLYLRRLLRRMHPDDIKLLENLILHKSWWDTVDDLAAHPVGAYFLQYPDQTASLTQRWIQSDSLWLRRTALLYQLRYKEHTDWDLLSTYILHCKEDPEFFIRKAIGWALREYAKTNPETVLAFVRDHQDDLSPLSVREALKNLELITQASLT